MVTRERLHELVNGLRDDDLAPAADYLAELGARHDALLARLLAAPYDHEPETDEERQGVAEARQQYREGRYLTADEAKRKLLE